MKKKFIRNRLKGMTLVEVLVAICIFGLTSLALATCAGFIQKTLMANISFNEKMNIQAPLVDNKQTGSGVTGVAQNIVIKDSTGSVVDSVSGNYVYGNETDTNEENGLNFSYVR